jgi:hypothetical protein
MPKNVYKHISAVIVKYFPNVNIFSAVTIKILYKKFCAAVTDGLSYHNNLFFQTAKYFAGFCPLFIRSVAIGHYRRTSLILDDENVPMRLVSSCRSFEVSGCFFTLIGFMMTQFFLCQPPTKANLCFCAR